MGSQLEKRRGWRDGNELKERYKRRWNTLILNASSQMAAKPSVVFLLLSCSIMWPINSQDAKNNLTSACVYFNLQFMITVLLHKWE